MAKLDDAAYIVLKEEYVAYVGQSVWELIDHLLTTHGWKDRWHAESKSQSINDKLYICYNSRIDGINNKVRRVEVLVYPIAN